MNKYEKLIKQLQSDFDEEFSAYKEEIDQLNNNAEAMRYKYNDQIHAINSLRQNLQDEIAALYKFLRRFGDFGKKITPFDYVTEDSRHGKGTSINEKGVDHNGDSRSSGFLKTAAIPALIFAPTTLPALWAADAISKRSKCKKEYQNLEIDFENRRTEWDKAKQEKRAEAQLYKDATEIANIYRALIGTVRMAIRETILPELTGIDAFLVADAIKNALISDIDPEDAEIASISMYQGTAYDMHYIFVRNACDYYTMIVRFFTEPILTNIMADNKVTSEEQRAFRAKVAQIKDQTKLLEDTSMFGGAV